MNAARWLAAAVAVLALIMGDVASQEVRARLDRLPFAVLRLARARLPAELRERVHDQEWLPELQHILKHAELFPLTRLVIGLRYAAGLLIRAGTVAAELRPPDAAQVTASGGKSRWRRLTERSAGLLHTLIWPVREPLRVRLYVTGVTAVAAAVTGTAAVSTPIHAPNLELFAILVACSVAAHRTPAFRDSLAFDLKDVWLLPAAILLPPVYALIAPVPVTAAFHRRNPGHAYRRVFSAASIGLAFGAVSELVHTAALPTAGHVLPSGPTSLSWALVIAGCGLLATAAVKVFVLTAIKVATPSTRILQLLANQTAARYELTNLVLGTAATFAAAVNPLLVIAVLPGVILAYKHLTPEAPAPTATR